MHPETLHVVDRTGQAGDFKLAAVARTCIDLANRECSAKETRDAALEPTTDFNCRRVASLQQFGHKPRLPNLPEQLHAALRDSRRECQRHQASDSEHDQMVADPWLVTRIRGNGPVRAG